MDNPAYLIDDEKVSSNGVPPLEKKLPIEDKVKEEEDPWKVTSLSTHYEPWSELDGKHKFLRVFSYFVKIILVLGCLYLFICSLDFLSSAFKLLGGEAAGRVFQQDDIMTNPLAGLMMGVMVTVLVQSSSTSTSIVVSMVGAQILKIKTAIPIIMGANIGTSVTNTIVALGQISDEGEFRRAFAGATVHDMFNWLSVLVLLPIEIATGMLFKLTEKIVDSLHIETQKDAKKDILKVVTKPFTEKIIQINKDAITSISKDEEPEIPEDHIIMKICCDETPPIDCCKDAAEDHKDDFLGDQANLTFHDEFCAEINQCVTSASSVPANCRTNAWSYEKLHQELRFKCGVFTDSDFDTQCCNEKFASNNLTYASTITDEQKKEFCTSLHDDCNGEGVTSCLDKWSVETVTVQGQEKFSCVDWAKTTVNTTCNSECDYLFKGLYPDLNDQQVGGILLVISLAILCLCLVLIVKLLHSLLKGPIAVIIKKFVNADIPGPLGYLTGYLAILIGAGLTIVVQSSSIFTSSITPLVGIGVIELDRMYPLTLGSNIGTTTTSILSALTSSGVNLKNSLQVAFAHLFFNIFGIMIFYPFPFFRPAIPLAKFLGNRTAKYRWFAIAYIFAMFFIFPATIFSLSVAGWKVLAGVLIPVVCIIVFVIIIKACQEKCPGCLPHKLQNWKFLPLFMRSLAPYDKVMRKVFFCSRFQRKKDGDVEMTRL